MTNHQFKTIVDFITGELVEGDLRQAIYEMFKENRELSEKVLKLNLNDAKREYWERYLDEQLKEEKWN